MPKPRRPERLLPQLQNWSDQELLDLAAMIQGLLESRQNPPDQAPTRPDGSPLGKHGGRGHLESKMIRDAKTQKSYGPYLYLRYWGTSKEGKKSLKSVYLGKDGSGTTHPGQPS